MTGGQEAGRSSCSRMQNATRSAIDPRREAGKEGRKGGGEFTGRWDGAGRRGGGVW